MSATDESTSTGSTGIASVSASDDSTSIAVAALPLNAVNSSESSTTVVDVITTTTDKSTTATATTPLTTGTATSKEENLMTSGSTIDAINDTAYRIAKELLLSLPPMEYNELEYIVNHISQFVTLSLTNDDGSDNNNNNSSNFEKEWKENVSDPFWNEYQIRTCRRNIETTTGTATNDHTVKSGSSFSSSTLTTQLDYTEYISYLQKQMQDYQISQYGDKPNVTATFQVATADAITGSNSANQPPPQELPVVTTGGVHDGSDDDTQPTTASKKTVVVRTYVEYIDTSNYCTGSWEGDWEIQILNEITASISGSIRIRTHYYENNVNSQTQCQQESIHKIVSLEEEKVNSLVAKFEQNTMSYAEKLVTKIVQWMIHKEQEYYVSIIDDMFTNNNNNNGTTMEDQLRSIRRILPITKTKFQWSNNASASTQQKNVQMQFMHKMCDNNKMKRK